MYGCVGLPRVGTAAAGVALLLGEGILGTLVWNLMYATPPYLSVSVVDPYIRPSMLDDDD